MAAAPGVVALRHHLPEAVEARQGACTAHRVVEVHRNQGQVRLRSKRGRAHHLPDLNHSLHVRKTSPPGRLKAPLPAIASMEVHSAHPTAALLPAGLQAKTGLSTTPAKAGTTMHPEATGPTMLHVNSQARAVAHQPATAVTQNQTKEEPLAAIGLQMPTGHQALTGLQVATGLQVVTEPQAVTAAQPATAAREQVEIPATTETPGQTEIQVPTGPEATAPEATTSTLATTTTSTSMPSATQWWW